MEIEEQGLVISKARSFNEIENIKVSHFKGLYKERDRVNIA
jgi:hypothetical protein